MVVRSHTVWVDGDLDPQDFYEELFKIDGVMLAETNPSTISTMKKQ